MKSPHHTILGTYLVDSANGGEYVLILLCGETEMARFSTTSPAVAGAASGLMDLAVNPEVVASVWRYATGAGTADIVRLDAIGDALVQEMEDRQRELSS